MPEPVDFAAINGADTAPGTTPPGGTSARLMRRRVIVGAVVLFATAWAIALTYSVTAGGRSPERLDDPAARTVETACREAEHALAALPPVGVHPTFSERAIRVANEDKILSAMVDRLRALHPKPATPATALTGWLSDWQRLITAREQYASDLTTRRADARFVEPATRGVQPIADKMNNWILEQGTRTNTCNTGVLQVEVVDGPRAYGPGRKS